MNMKDLIADRGESIFKVLITDWCRNNANLPWFSEAVFLGQKHQTTDFMVELYGAGATFSMFYVQVKATRSPDTGDGAGTEADVGVRRGTKSNASRTWNTRRTLSGSTLIQKGYIKAITPAMTSGFRGISTNAEITCATLKQLWAEVYAFWSTMSGRILNTNFA